MTDSRCRHAFGAVRAELLRRLAEPPTGLVQLISGPRQVGKTTLLLELARREAPRAVYAASDTPAASLPGWWDNLWARVEGLAQERTALLLLDEAQYLPDWSRLLKTKADEVKRHGRSIQVIATGSSALSIAHGSQETMAGRFERLKLLHWQVAELSQQFDLESSAAARDLVRHGGYPGAVPLLADAQRWKAYVQDAIVEPAIGRDLLAIEAIRKPGLLRQVFAVSVGHPAQIVSLQKIQGRLQDPGALATIAHYLHLLEEACLVAAVRKYSGRAVRRRAAPPKLICLSNALLAAAVDGSPPTPESQPEVWGRWLENACIAMAWNCGQTIYYWREEPLEVDLVMEGTWGKWAVEIKSGAFDVRAVKGTLEFCRRYPAFRPLLVCDPDRIGVVESTGVTAVSWQKFLMSGPPA